MDSAATVQACPACEESLPVLAGYMTWCHECGWNLAPPTSRQKAGGPVERVRAAAGRRLGTRLAEQLIAASSLEPRLTPARAAAYAIAVAVHLLTLGLAVGGVALAASTWPNAIAIALGVVMVGASWLMRPRLGKAPKQGVLQRADAPALYGLADDVAAALSTPPVDLVVVSGAFNASWSVVGVRRRRVLTLGLPLVTSLERDELVALVGHELAHARNGDAQRGFLVGSAVDGLGELYGLLSPGGSVNVPANSRAGAVAWLGAHLGNAILWFLSQPVLWLLYLELYLLLRDGQRAEYLADSLAADVAGTDATVGLVEKLLLSSTVEGVLQRAVHARPDEGGDVFDAIAATVEAVPDRERERRRRVARLEDARLDDTHPPTGMRIRLLEERPLREATVEIDEERGAAIARELGRFRRSYAAALVEARRARLYARYR